MSDQEFDEVGRGYWRCEGLDGGGGSDAEDNAEDRHECSKEEANLLSSLCIDGLHRPVIDFDIPARYLPSTTPGHGHLYIDKPITWEQYVKLLDVLVEIGYVEPGHVSASKSRSATYVRPEWVKKPTVEKAEETDPPSTADDIEF